ncbi:MAG TPA: hypothetical protein DHU55_00825 [Blastocatellia bacterium]|jgi:hypothetical protein|nr:hypothetical protein [Blastocatellia bacterium]
MNDQEATRAGVSRRDFAKASSLVALATLFPSVTWLEALQPVAGLSARLISRSTEDLPNRGTRTTIVTEYDSPAGLRSTHGVVTQGFRTRQTTVETRTPTANGDVVEYDITFDPPVPTATGSGAGGRLHVRAEFVHGPTRPGGMREDTVTITQNGDTVQAGTTVHHVLRPISLPAAIAAMSPAQRLQYVVDKVNQNQGRIPSDLPATMQFLD